MGAPGHGFPGGAERKTLDEVSPVAREHELGETGGTRWRKVRNHTAARAGQAPGRDLCPDAGPQGGRPKGAGAGRPDATVQVQADTHTQRAMWLMVCSIADAYGFGPSSCKSFSPRSRTTRTSWSGCVQKWTRNMPLKSSARRRRRVTGMEVHYLYEQEALLAEMQAAKEGVLAHE